MLYYIIVRGYQTVSLLWRHNYVIYLILHNIYELSVSVNISLWFNHCNIVLSSRVALAAAALASWPVATFQLMENNAPVLNSPQHPLIHIHIHSTSAPILQTGLCGSHHHQLNSIHHHYLNYTAWLISIAVPDHSMTQHWSAAFCIH